MHGAIDIWRLNMTRKRIKSSKKNSMDLPKALFKPILNEKFLYINHLDFIPFSFPCVFLKHWSLSLYPPTPPPKRTKEKENEEMGVRFLQHTFNGLGKKIVQNIWDLNFVQVVPKHGLLPQN